MDEKFIEKIRLEVDKNRCIYIVLILSALVSIKPKVGNVLVFLGGALMIPGVGGEKVLSFGFVRLNGLNSVCQWEWFDLDIHTPGERIPVHPLLAPNTPPP